MKVSTILNYKTMRGFVAFLLIFTSVVPVLVPVITSAAQITERSIELTSSSVSAEGVTYKVNFKAATAAGAFVVDFCDNTPTVGQECDAPAGFDLSAATSSTSGFTDLNKLDANTVVVAGTIAQNADISVELAAIDNPSAVGPLYARIVTYDTDTNADLYVSDSLDEDHVVDSGGVAISITETIGVSGAVLESITFCVAKVAITADCANAGAPENAPTIKIGETVGDTVALVSSAISTGNIYTQISTNAVSGAVVNLKSNATGCGGLKRAGAPLACDILPALDDGITVGEAKFGVRTANATDTGASPTGAFQPVNASNYNNDTYALNYAANNLTGVTSPYGDPFLNTNSAPANNKNMQLTFGASVSNSTPAGNYSADLSLIATGKF